MSVSLLKALLPKVEPAPSTGPDPDRDLKKEEYPNWHGGSAERQALMLQALYDVLYEYAKMDTQEGKTVGTLLAVAVSKASGVPTSYPSGHEDHVKELRHELKEELQKRFDNLKKKFPPLKSS